VDTIEMTYGYSMRKQRHVIISVDLSRGYYLNDSHINGKHEHIINFVDPCWTYGYSMRKQRHVIISIDSCR
jgi:hypothetical protein